MSELILKDAVSNLRKAAHWRRIMDPNDTRASVLDDVASAIDSAIPKAEITITDAKDTTT